MQSVMRRGPGTAFTAYFTSAIGPDHDATARTRAPSSSAPWPDMATQAASVPPADTPNNPMRDGSNPKRCT